jgi:hypothetical protein
MSAFRAFTTALVRSASAWSARLAVPRF